MAGQETKTLPDAMRTVAAWVADAAAQGRGEASRGRRRHLRFVWPAAIEVLLNQGTPSEQQIFATGLDVSESGMGLVVRRVMPLGAKVVLRYADDGEACPWVPAHVVHTAPAAGGYRVGVEFELRPAP